ncbi:afg1 ATPase [Hyphodiscus hymeniophilus]|uniref:Afg1 ATPase n=1 Tax=Hyphodiscus hymeniophilus TaxID=353542 RepID=A0A9P7AVF2_9HELO|nr:afg1 ATPase [Hyphodiscus hymeniophilus]
MSKVTLQASYAALLRRRRLAQNPGQAALVTRLASLQDELAKPNHSHPNQGCSPKGLYIYGSVGTGKSRIADLFIATLPSSVSARRTHFHEFMIDIHTRLHHARSLPGYSGDPLLQIGMEVTDIADALILKRLFGAIWESGGVMVSTSNRAPEKLYENGLNRYSFLPFIDNLQRRCEVWKMEGSEDYRMRGRYGRRLDIFFTKEDMFERSLRDAIGSSGMNEIVISVMMGRQLKVSATTTNNSGKLVTTMRYARRPAPSILEDFANSNQINWTTLGDLLLLWILLTKQKLGFIVPRIYVEGGSKDQPSLDMTVIGEGGSSSSMMSTFIGEMEWSATGLSEASLAAGGAGEIDVGFAVGRAVSRLYEMGSETYGNQD